MIETIMRSREHGGWGVVMEGEESEEFHLLPYVGEDIQHGHVLDEECPCGPLADLEQFLDREEPATMWVHGRWTTSAYGGISQ